MEIHQVRFPGGDGDLFNSSGIQKAGENIDRISFHAGNSGIQMSGFCVVLYFGINFVTLVLILLHLDLDLISSPNLCVWFLIPLNT